MPYYRGICEVSNTPLLYTIQFF